MSKDWWNGRRAKQPMPKHPTLAFWIKICIASYILSRIDVPFENCWLINNNHAIYWQCITDGKGCQMPGSIKYELLKSKWRDFSTNDWWEKILFPKHPSLCTDRNESLK